MLPFIGPAIAAATNLIGGFMGQNEAENARHQREMELARAEALQREFAQTGIQWKVADAKKAGIHPMYALGAPTMSPAVSVSSGASSNPMGAALSSMGQDISRAMVATGSASTRDAMVNTTMQELQLKNMELRNNLVAAQIAKLSGGQVGPPGPGDFVVPENAKPEERPPLMLGGSRWRTSPNTSPMKAWEDQYGDEGPVASTLPLAILWNDMKKNPTHPYHPDQWPGALWKWIDQAAEDHINRKLAPPPVRVDHLRRHAQPAGRR